MVYHSHTGTEAYPSRTDISYAGEPQAHYVLVSTREPDTHEFRSYRIVDGVVTEEPVEIIPAGADVAVRRWPTTPVGVDARVARRSTDRTDRRDSTATQTRRS